LDQADSIRARFSRQHSAPPLERHFYHGLLGKLCTGDWDVQDFHGSGF
jgi:hypothetical protein